MSPFEVSPTFPLRRCDVPFPTQRHFLRQSFKKPKNEVLFLRIQAVASLKELRDLREFRSRESREREGTRLVSCRARHFLHSWEIAEGDRLNECATLTSALHLLDIVVPEDVAAEKVQLLQVLGAEVEKGAPPPSLLPCLPPRKPTSPTSLQSVPSP